MDIALTTTLFVVHATKTNKARIGEIIRLEGYFGTDVGEGMPNNILKFLICRERTKVVVVGGEGCKCLCLRFSRITRKLRQLNYSA